MTSSSSSTTTTMLKNLLPFQHNICENPQCNDLHGLKQQHQNPQPQEKCLCMDITSGPASPTTSHDYHYIHYPVEPITTTTTTSVAVASSSTSSSVASSPPDNSKSLQNLSPPVSTSFIVSGQAPQPQHDINLNRSSEAATMKENNDNMQILNNGMIVAATSTTSIVATVSPSTITTAPGSETHPVTSTHVASVTVHHSHPQNQPSIMHHHNHQHHPSIDDNNAIDISPSCPCNCEGPATMTSEKDSNIHNVITTQKRSNKL